MTDETEEINFEAVVTKEGKLDPVDGLLTRARIARWAGKRISVTLCRWLKPKTNPQLGYYYGVIRPYWAARAGYTEDELHRELKLAYLPAQFGVSKLTGEKYRVIPSLRDQNVEQMGAFIDRCLAEAALQGIYIPGPSEPITAEV